MIQGGKQSFHPRFRCLPVSKSYPNPNPTLTLNPTLTPDPNPTLSYLNPILKVTLNPKQKQVNNENLGENSAFRPVPSHFQNINVNKSAEGKKARGG